MEPQEEAECIAEFFRQRVAAEVILAAHCQEYQPHINGAQKRIYQQLLPALQHQALQQHQELQQQALHHLQHQHQQLQQQFQYQNWHYPPDSIAYPQEVYSEQYRNNYLTNGITHQEDLEEKRNMTITNQNSLLNCTKNDKACVVPNKTALEIEDRKNATCKRKKITHPDDDRVQDLDAAAASNSEANYESPELLRFMAAMSKEQCIPHFPPQEQLHHRVDLMQTTARSVTPPSLTGWEFFAVGSPDLSSVTNDWILKLVPLNTDERTLEISGPAVSAFLNNRR